MREGEITRGEVEVVVPREEAIPKGDPSLGTTPHQGGLAAMGMDIVILTHVGMMSHQLEGMKVVDMTGGGGTQGKGRRDTPPSTAVGTIPEIMEMHIHLGPGTGPHQGRGRGAQPMIHIIRDLLQLGMHGTGGMITLGTDL